MRVVLIGATTNSDRYAFTCTQDLVRHGHEVFLLGIKNGIVAGVPIINDKPIIPNVDTVTLYVGPKNQEEWLEYIVAIKPRRVIFNPGTENSSAYTRLNEAGISYENACTLVLLATNQF
ncbi:MAG: CoA-binding protein [Cytophagaceae bacterium]